MIARYKEKAHHAIIRPFVHRGFRKYTRQEDVFIVTYPKSGTVWMGFTLANIQNLIYKYTDTLNLKDYTNIVPDANFALVKPGWLKQFSGLNSPRAFTTHATKEFSELLPRVVYITRDPRDVVVSYYHHHRRYFKGFNKSISEFVYDFDNYSPSSWIEHVEGWMKYNGNENFMFVTYENLKTDTFNVIKSIVRFAKFNAGDDIIKKAIELSSFENMKRLEKEFGGAMEPKGDKSGSFVRKGKKGGFKEELSEELIRFINEKVGETVKRYSLPYDI
jgi:hypothetical protein